MKNIIQEETEEENKRVVNNYWKIRSFLNSKIVWDMQFHVIARTPIEEQEECLNFIKENEDNIKKNGLYVPFIDQDISIEEEEKMIFQRTLYRREYNKRKYTEKKFNRTYVDSHTPTYANRVEFGLSAYEIKIKMQQIERKLNYGKNKYGKKIIRNRDKGIT